MLLTIETTHKPATDLGYLLHKHPDRWQTFDLSFGQAHVFYPEASEDRCTACLLLDVDPVGMVRGKRRDQSFLLGALRQRPALCGLVLHERGDLAGFRHGDGWPLQRSPRTGDDADSVDRPGSMSCRFVAAKISCIGFSSRWVTRSKPFGIPSMNASPNGARVPITRLPSAGQKRFPNC